MFSQHFSFLVIYFFIYLTSVLLLLAVVQLVASLELNFSFFFWILLFHHFQSLFFSFQLLIYLDAFVLVLTTV